MKHNKILILGAAFTLAMTPLLVGCGEMASAMRYVKHNKIVEKIGTISFGSNDVKINEATVTGKDNLDNERTITTVGTTSFTSNAAYYQVGSSNKPATSITFTTTLPSAQTITNMSAKFGGFNGTAGNIALKVGNTTIGSGSLNATNDVTIENTNNSTSGTELTVTVTGIAKGVKVYYISYSYSYEEDDNPFVVTFNSNEGSSVSPQNINSDGISKATRPNNPTRDGYDFGGWYSDAELTSLWDFDDPITESMTLYAKRTKVAITSSYSYSSLNNGNGYRIVGEVTNKVNNNGFFIQNGLNAFYVYDKNTNDSVSVGNEVDLYGTVTTYNGVKELTNIAYCTKNSEDTTNSQTVLTSLSDVTSENMYKYIEISGLQLASVFSTNNSNSYYTATLVGSNVTLYTGYKSYVNGGAFTHTDYAENDFISVKGNIYIDSSSNIEIYFTSIEKMEQHIVSFDSKGGSSVSSQTVLDGNTASEPTAPTKDADEDYTYTFDAWYADENCEGEPFDFSTAITSDITLYAGWIRTEIPAVNALKNIKTIPSLSYSYHYESSGNTYSPDTFVSKDAGYSNAANVDSVTIDDVNITFDIGTGSTHPKYYDSGEGIRTYNGNTMTFETSVGKIKEIELTFDGSNHGTFSANVGTYTRDGSTATWSGSSKTIIFTGGSTSRIKSIKVVYSDFEEEYSFNKIAMRFGGTVSKTLRSKIGTQGRIDAYGVAFSKKNDLDAYINDAGLTVEHNTLEEAYERTMVEYSCTSDEALDLLTDGTGISNYFLPLTQSRTSPGSLDEDNYYWSGYLPIEATAAAVSTQYIAQTYIVIDGAPVFMESSMASVKQLANDLLETDAYDEDSLDGSLAYLAGLE